MKKPTISAAESKFRSDRRNKYRMKILQTDIRPISVVKVVLILLERYNLQDDYCFPGLAKIVEDTKLSPAAVKIALSAALEMNLIKRDRRTGTSTKTTFNWNFTEADVVAGRKKLEAKKAEKKSKANSHKVSSSTATSSDSKSHEVSSLTATFSHSNSHEVSSLTAMNVATNIKAEPKRENLKEINIKEKNLEQEHDIDEAMNFLALEELEKLKTLHRNAMNNREYPYIEKKVLHLIGQNPTLISSLGPEFSHLGLEGSSIH